MYVNAHNILWSPPAPEPSLSYIFNLKWTYELLTHLRCDVQSDVTRPILDTLQHNESLAGSGTIPPNVSRQKKQPSDSLPHPQIFQSDAYPSHEG